jgi:FkbM family methyltransferase
MIYIDCGAYDGDTILPFVKTYTPQKIFAFEANPYLINKLQQNVKHLPVEIIQKAVWIENGKQEFAIDKHQNPFGSTLIKEKTNTWHNENPKVIVETIDFSSFLKQFIGQEVYVKIDIEGAEFAVMEKLIRDRTDAIITKLNIEFHHSKIGEDVMRANKIMDRFKGRTYEL